MLPGKQGRGAPGAFFARAQDARQQTGIQRRSKLCARSVDNEGVWHLIELIPAALSVISAVVSLVALIFGREDPRFEGDKLIYRS